MSGRSCVQFTLAGGILGQVGFVLVGAGVGFGTKTSMFGEVKI